MLAAVAVAKIAGIATLLILAWFVVKIVRGGPSAPAEGTAADPIGEMILRGFTWMLMIGVAAAFAISIGEVIDAL
ncbi:hypothetical protein P2H44_12600 [Albimonas sp. CAU 1670]|uniref:hypothetical protein n=1 Tax=Albimonas sp. CAU 1670 TaxID=3032599 RepID=UPI0023D97F03|nr:hypothetical protein [Albimonas sp. CAU 1670]MDF2233395.1 hypothetical protein [Albimonas sp. CAU 1670]